MSVLVASRSAVTACVPCHGSGAVVKCSVRRKLADARKTKPVRTFWRVAPKKGSKLRGTIHRSQEQASLVTHKTEDIKNVSLLCRRRASSHGAFTPVARRLKDNDHQQYRRLTPRSGLKHEQQAAKVLQRGQGGAAARTTPNPSFKPSPNGGPPGPVWRYAVHFRQPGPGVPPLVPA